ncbi:hypothetical protein AAMO2058_000696900 [Amorphochlora amoebiformis]
MSAATRTRALPRLLLVSPGTHLRSQDIRPLYKKMGDMGMPAVCLREPHLSDEEMRELYDDLRSHIPTVVIHSKHKSAFDISADVHIASPFSRGGAPMGWAAFERIAELRRRCKGLLGISCHTPSEVKHSIDGGADYVTLSPVWESSKKSFPLVSMDDYVATCEKISDKDGLCLAQAGGTPERLESVLAAGGHGIAIAGDIHSRSEEDALKRLDEYLEVLNQY